jgi:hypothetical protein
MLNCRANQLTYLPTLPDSLRTIDCDKNPMLYKLYQPFFYSVDKIRKKQLEEEEFTPWVLK